jgi:hypothetical protein
MDDDDDVDDDVDVTWMMPSTWFAPVEGEEQGPERPSSMMPLPPGTSSPSLRNNEPPDKSYPGAGSISQKSRVERHTQREYYNSRHARFYRWNC